MILKIGKRWNDEDDKAIEASLTYQDKINKEDEEIRSLHEKLIDVQVTLINPEEESECLYLLLHPNFSNPYELASFSQSRDKTVIGRTLEQSTKHDKYVSKPISTRK